MNEFLSKCGTLFQTLAHLNAGDLAKLRKLDVAQPPLLFYKAASKTLCEEDMRWQSKWATVVKAQAVVLGTNPERNVKVQSQNSFGKAMELAGVSERRVAQLLEAPVGFDTTLPLIRIINQTINAGMRFDMLQVYNYIQYSNISEKNYSKLNIAMDFYKDLNRNS